MKKITRAEFYRTIDGKKLTCIFAGFIGKENAFERFTIARIENTFPINTGIVTIRSNGFYRTMEDGKQSFFDSKAGQEVYTIDNIYYLIITGDNAVCYKMS